MAIKIKVKADGKDAKKILSGQMPDATGANFVTRNELFVPPGATSGEKHASERVAYKPRPGIAGKSEATPELIGNEREQVVKPETGSLAAPVKAEGFGASYVGEGIITVVPVARVLNPVERARQDNNRTRDMRTNLGRGKPSQPTTDAGSQTPTR